MEQRPALMLPMGEQDYVLGNRMKFMKSVAPILNRLGWTWGIEGKGALGEWARSCFPYVKKLGGRITFHPPGGIAKGLGDQGQIPEKLLKEAELVPEFIELGLEAYTIHLAPAIAVDPPENMGLERYNSPIDAGEMVEHIKRQVDPLKQLNEMTKGILHIENVDITNFRGGGYRVPTFLALQAGCWIDLWWLKEQTGVKTTVDSEHFYCASNLLLRERQEDLKALDKWDPDGTDETLAEFFEISGYWLKKGLPPLGSSMFFGEFMQMITPQLFHFGGATRAIDHDGRIATHLPFDLNHRIQKQTLDYQLRSIASGQGIGAVVEVCGQLQPEKYSPWSPRPYDDEVAKMQTYLTVMNEIEHLKK